MSRSFPTPDRHLLRRYGVTGVHFSNGLQTTVTVILGERGIDAAPPVQRVLFGTMRESGFVAVPRKGDRFMFDDEQYRVYDVKQDRPGNESQTDGIWIHLTFDE
jgi:hypothetical protein